MSGRGYQPGRVREERRDAGDKALQEGLAAVARSALDSVLCLATVRNVKWEDALAEFEPAWRAARDTLLERLEAKRGRR